MSPIMQRIVIVGGGTAGWMTAAYLNRALGNSASITLIESASIGTIGVGEASFNTIKLFFDYIGLDEREWMPSCNATYKIAIKFRDWSHPGSVFFHPFQRFSHLGGFSLAEWWLQFRDDLGHPLDDACFVVPKLCDHVKSPRFLDGTVFEEPVGYHPYGYHFDAALLARTLQALSIQRGVTHVIGDVSHVALDECGAIERIETKQGDTIEGDLFIDCTGFRGLLINQTLHEPFISFGDTLLCDSAIAMRIPRDGAFEGINPYTSATALNAGWVWDIPLFDRVGTGYVYSSAYVSRDEAECELRAHLGSRSEGHEAFALKMRIGRCRNSWVKNCVAVGLASGFVEPLESTGLFFIQYAVAELVNHFPESTVDESVVDNYNRIIAECIDGVRDFLVLHYCTSPRSDTSFWRTAQMELKIPDDLRRRLALWRHRLPNASNIYPWYHGFAPFSYAVMLAGMGYLPGEGHPLLRSRAYAECRPAFEAIQHRAEELVTSLPTHADYLAQLYAGAAGEDVRRTS